MSHYNLSQKKVRKNMKINGITGYNYNNYHNLQKKQVNFGIIEDDDARKIIEENAKHPCTLFSLENSKFFIFSSEGQKLKVRLDEELLFERTTDTAVEEIKTDKWLDFEHPEQTIDYFASEARVWKDFEDPNKPQLRQIVAENRAFMQSLMDGTYEESEAARELDWKCRQAEKEEEERRIWDRAHNDLAI